MASIFDRLSAAFDAFKRGEPLEPGALQPPARSAIGGYISFPGWDQIERDAMRQSHNDQSIARSALTSYLVYRSVNAISQELSASLLQVVRRNGEEDEEVANHPFEVRWESPNPYMGRSFLMQYWTFQLLLTGEAYLYIIPGNGGIAELWPVPSWYIAPKPDPKLFIDGYLWQPDPQRQALKIPKEYIVYSRLPNPFDLRRGLSPLASIMTEVEGDLAMSRWNRAFFSTENAVPSGLISVPRDTLDTDMQRIRQEIFDFFGSGNRRVAVARSGDIEWKEFGRSQKDMEFLQGRQFTERAVLTAFGIPEGYFAKDATRANSEGAKATFIENAVWPKMVMLAEDLNSQLVDRYYPGHRVVFEDIRPRNRAIEMEEFRTLSTVLTVDELRARFKYDSLGDVRGAMLISEVDKQQPIVSTPADQIVQVSLAPDSEPEPDPEPEPPDEPMAPEDELEAVKADLQRWERKAIKALKARGRAAVGFSSAYIEHETADQIATGLKACTTAEEVRSVFVPFVKAVDFEELTPRERRLYFALRRVLENSLDPVAQAIIAGTPVDLSTMSDELREQLEPVLTQTFIEQMEETRATLPPRVSVQIPAPSDVAANWAQQYTFGLVSQLNETTLRVLQRATAEFLGTPGMTRADLEARIAPAFGAQRASMIAVTETTRAASAAMTRTADYLNANQMPTVRVWRTLNDELTCPICGPLDGLPEYEWNGIDAPPAHPRCRCSITLRMA
jgi:HK97 family phage portal protein